MSFARIFLWCAACLVVACGEGSGGEPTEPPGPSLAEVLEAAGADPVALCALVRESPDAPEAEQARARLNALREPGAERWASAVRERRIRPELREALDTVFARGETDPCARHFTVYVERAVRGDGAFEGYPTLPNDPATGNARTISSTWGQLIEFSSAWPTGEETTAALIERLRAIDAEWLQPVYSAYPPSRDRAHLLITYNVRSGGRVGTQHWSYVGLSLEVLAQIVVPAAGDVALRTREVSLGWVRLPETFSVRYRASTGAAAPPPPPQSVIDQQIRELTRTLSETLSSRLGLDPPDPQLAPFAGRYSLDGTAQSDGCAARITLAAQHVDIDAIERTAVADVVDRTYAARVEDGALVAEGRFQSSSPCAGSEIVETWRLTRSDEGLLTGHLDSAWAVPPECTDTCSVRFALSATPVEGDPAR